MMSATEGIVGATGQWVVVVESAEFGVTTARVHGPYRSWQRAEAERLRLHGVVNASTVGESHEGDHPAAMIVKCEPGKIDVPDYVREWDVDQ